MAAAAAAVCMFATPTLASDAAPSPTVAGVVEPSRATVPSSPTSDSAPGARSSEIPVLNPPAPLALPTIRPAPPAPSLSELVDAHGDMDALDAERECLATAVYFEARGESLEGQLAVAEVVLNRVASGRYPPSACAVVKQAAQFSFVRKGKMPPVAKASTAWRKAVAIAHIAWKRLARQVGSGVLWYHADYVSPGWGRRLKRIAQIGLHIFYSVADGLAARTAKR